MSRVYREDLTGRKFNMLTVISEAQPRFTPKSGITRMWNCMCECGTETVVSGGHLKSGSTKSCGCLKHRRPKRFKNLEGQKFGRLTVMSLGDKHTSPSGQTHTVWNCVCECGNTIAVMANSLQTGNTMSCGCLLLDKTTKHGLSRDSGKHRISVIHAHMISRCKNSNDNAYKYYGGRGITVCKEWEDLKTFADWAFNNGYDDYLTIDRIDVNGNYEPSNCRWITMREQQNNKRSSVRLSYKGKTHTISEWAQILNVKYDTLYSRYRYGQSEEKMFRELTEGS